MTPETYERALELQERINELLEQKEAWELATGIDEESSLWLTRPSGHTSLEVDTAIIPFATLRRAVLADLEDEIKPLQFEFDEL